MPFQTRSICSFLFYLKSIHMHVFLSAWFIICYQLSLSGISRRTNWKWILLNISLHLNCLKFIVLQIQFRYIVTNVLFINVHSDYEENSFKNQYCFIETSLTWNDAKVRCVLYSNNLPISFFQICIHHLHLLWRKALLQTNIFVRVKVIKTTNTPANMFGMFSSSLLSIK